VDLVVVQRGGCHGGRVLWVGFGPGWPSDLVVCCMSSRLQSSMMMISRRESGDLCVTGTGNV
jgi:hypothetical protein